MIDRRIDKETRDSVSQNSQMLGKPIIHYGGKIHFVGLEDCLHYAKLSQLNNDKILLKEVRNALEYLLKD